MHIFSLNLINHNEAFHSQFQENLRSEFLILRTFLTIEIQLEIDYCKTSMKCYKNIFKAIATSSKCYLF